MTQYGFFIDQSRCIGCNSCTIACKQWHDIPPGPVKWMRIHQWEKGTYPNARLHILPVMCYHCENPVCVRACENGALYKEPTYGAVLVQVDRCRGCRGCWKACPYGAPQYDGDGEDAKMSKCTMCLDRLEKGLKPICVLSCSMRAMEFGPLDDLMKKYGKLRSLEDMPKDSMSRPSVVFKPADSKKQVVPWDAMKALELWKRRNADSEDLRPVFSKPTDVTEAPTALVGRNRLVLKAGTHEEMMRQTTDDE